MTSSESPTPDPISEWIIGHRRNLHRIPEPSHFETRTRAYLQAQLDALGIKHYSLTGKDVIGVVEGTQPGPTVLVRSDMDGLSVQEETGLSFASESPTTMHACGHDGHMAILLGVAKKLVLHGEFRGTVRLLFQHAEESMPGGARELVAAGVTDGVTAALGCHLWQPLASGVLGVRNGPIMAGADGFTFTIQGRGGHASTPQLTVDPILVASHAVTQLHTILSRSVDPSLSAVLSIGSFQSGEDYNVIPDVANVRGTVRHFSHETAQFIDSRIDDILNGVSRSFGASYDYTYTYGDPALVNSPEMTSVVAHEGQGIFGAENVLEVDPVFASEDFAYYSERVPSAFVFIGVGGDGRVHGHHSPKFDIDESVLAPAAELLYRSALAILRDS